MTITQRKVTQHTIIVDVNGDDTDSDIKQLIADSNYGTAVELKLIIKQYGYSLFFAKNIKDKTLPLLLSWNNRDKQDVIYQKIIRLCQKAQVIFAREDRVLSIKSPTIVFGDIHGNLRDLLNYEKVFWLNKIMESDNENVLFLGDYVDRGYFGIEVIIYMFALKILAPKKFYFIRGNHELRINTCVPGAHSFQKECTDKFGTKNGQSLHETINKVFDCLPFCAVIDGTIFCAHGGIPATIMDIKNLMSIPCPLPDPEKQCIAVWEILWNDPISTPEFGVQSEMIREISGPIAFTNLQGFFPNFKRGTGYVFNEEALNKFLQMNGLNQVIRAHETCQNGYRIDMKEKVITLFSTSQYCGGTNKGGCAYVTQDQIKLIKFN